MTKQQVAWIQDAKVIPAVAVIVGGIIGITAFWYTLKNEINSINIKLDYISTSITTTDSTAKANTLLIQQLDKRVTRLEDNVGIR